MAMKTKIIQVEQILLAAETLQRGECVAFPTETVYGLGANAFDPSAVEKIFVAKKRPADNPLIVHIYQQEQVRELVKDYSPAADRLMEKFWPGPLSLILPKSDRISKFVTGGLDTVALRMPDHELALTLLEATKLPIAAPSANLSGSPSPTRAEHVYQDLAGRIPLILDGGSTGWGLESTVVDCTSQPFRILRPGGVTLEELRKIVPIEVDPNIDQNNDQQKPLSPGMKYKHYAPDANVILVEGDRIPEMINSLAKKEDYAGLKLGVLARTENLQAYQGLTVLDLGSGSQLEIVASRLYHLLRTADQLGLDVIFVESFPEANVGMAIMNRLRRAANFNVIKS